MSVKTKATDTEISVMEVTRGQLDVCVLGTAPIIMNRMSEKAKRELLLPKGRKNAAEKASTMKHDPLAEYRASAYVSTAADAPTALMVMATSFKNAMRNAALDMPGTAKAQIGRLTYVNGDYVNIFGVPQMFMSVVRSKDMNRTPDVRTRVIVPTWGCRLSVVFVKPILREQSVANLLAAAGITQGIGDFRVEKGSGSYGTFELVSEDDPRFVEVQKAGRDAQVAALESPEFYDEETRELFEWHKAESSRRGFKVVA